MEVMDELFTIDDGYVPALIGAIDEYYYLVENMDPHKQSVCASFIMGLQNYTNVLAHHMAMLEGTWVVRGDHIDMAKEILYDLYSNLIQWLESEVKVGMAHKDRKNVEQAWKMAYKRSERFDFDDNRGEGWVKKRDLFNMFGQDMNLSSDNSINTKYNQFGAKLFEETSESRRKYVRLRKEHLKFKEGDDA